MIRHAVAGDKMRALMMARSFHAAAGMPFAFQAAHASLVFDTCLTDVDRVCIIYDVDCTAQGVLAAQAGAHPFGPFKVATEIMWWIEPAHRGRAALRMIGAYEDWARAQGCAFANLVGLGSEPVTTNLYERCGYAAAERHFMKPLAAR
ncbi:GNAT family N-acetyltransferase [Mesorhizobium sp. CGMCC 1.15528]|uniref:GNAT family N-acetyltransferase n=1 Tax=Mesorhizobium zhangyense TaxID=1776730 RepID=A0A7C9VFX5_9HYPH|nr:GNAT family N-acetyltransferase [Mesorhizobium zhangyense]NGN45187.1 GNAT family N-acetyltransferase [Mesorhizobium zhangyense]